MDEARRYRALIARLSAHRRLGTREHGQVLDLLRSPAATDREELAAALAGLLARGRDEWQRIFDLALHAERGPRSEALRQPPSPRRLALGVAAVLLAAALAGVAYVRPVPWRVTEVEPPPLTWRRQGQDPPQQPDLSIDTLEPAWQDERRLPGEPAVALRTFWPVCGAALLLWLAALRLLALPGSLLRSRRLWAQEVRRRWHRQQVASGAPPALEYRVTVDLPVPRQAVEDAATYLGRIHLLQGQGALDVPATLESSLARGGNLSPVWEVQRRPQELLVLVDEEDGHPPYLGGFLRIVDHWRRLGVRLNVLPFSPGAAVLREQERHHGGAPLLLYSRALSAQGLHGEAPFLQAIEAFWPRAWLDPDPRPEEERSPVERKHLREIGARLPRFPLSAAGLVQMARHLGGEVLPAGAEWPPLLPGAKVATELHRWAQLASLVPDPTWDQLEWLRQQMPSLRRLDQPGYLERLLEWLRARGTTHPEAGRRLRLEYLEPALRRALRQEEGQKGQAGAEERAVREELLRQLADAAPEDELLRELLRVKRALHRATLVPQEADALLLSVAGSPLYELVEGEVEFTQAPLARQMVKGGGAAPRDLLRLRGTVVPRWLWATVPLLLMGWLVPWAPWRFLRRAGAPLWETFAQVDRLQRLARVDVPAVPERRPPLQLQDKRAGGLHPPRTTVEPVPAPTLGQPVEGVSQETPERPRMVRIRAGLTLAQPVARDFAMATTEVTQAQYEQVMGKNPSYFKGARLPVEQVSLFDAVAYCNVLSQHEGRELCYDTRGAQVTWPRREKCLGYRLPTEAEWEYAARAGTRSKFAGGDDPAQVAWYAENSGGQTHSVGQLKANAWGLFDMNGNVWEWVCDALSSGLDGGARGGSWDFDPTFLRGDLRDRYSPSGASHALGFRISRSLP